MEQQRPEIDRIFHALGDPMRRAMVERLRERPHSVSALAKPLGITLTAVGQHLKVLEEAGLVRTEKLGRVRTVRLEAEGFAVLEGWAAERKGEWARRMDRLGDLLTGE
ncbi:MAG: ArsR/SmtB family transcription factor [Acidobacteriaceae bacterium]